MDCIFCKLAKEKESYIAETKHLFAVWDKYPVSKGHTMVIPKRHMVTMFELTKQEASELPIILQKVKEIIEEKYKDSKPAGYNIGSNNGSAAGQVIMHLHSHGIQVLGEGEPRE